MTKIKLPEGMRKAVDEAVSKRIGPSRDLVTELTAVKAALLWLINSDNIINLLPRAKLKEIRDGVAGGMLNETTILIAVCNAMGKMFLDPEPEIPEEIKDLMLPDIESGFFKPEIVNQRLAEAYRRGCEKNFDEKCIQWKKSQEGK